MGPKTRMMLVALVLVGSAIYAFLVAWNPQVASAIAVGYVAVLVTLLTAIQIWRHP